MKQLTLAAFLLLSLAAFAQTPDPAAHLSILTKRLRGESETHLNAQTSTYLDSVQYLYGNHNRIREVLNRHFTNGAWILQSRTQYLTCDSLGNATSIVFQTTDDDGIHWLNQERTEKTFHISGLLAYISVQYWLESIQEWVLETYHYYDYDDQGNLYWESDNYNNYYSIVNLYNQDGYLESSTRNIYVNSWIIYLTAKYFYYNPDKPGQLVLSYSYDYQSASGALVDSTMYRYDQEGNLRIRDIIEPGYVTDDCQQARRRTQFLDTENRLLRQDDFDACYMVDDTAINWLPSASTDFFYDADNDPLRWERQQYTGVDTGLLLHRYTYETVSKTTQAIPELSFALYPNPASEVVFLKMALGSAQLAKVFDLSGRELFRQVLQGNETEPIRLEGIPSGSYLLQITMVDGKTAGRPFVVTPR